MKKNIIKYLKRTAAFFSLLLAVIIFLVLFLVGTTPGTRWLVNRGLSYVESNTDFSVTIDSVSGAILYGLEIEVLRFNQQTESGETQVTVNQLNFNWSPWLFFREQLLINSLELSGLQVSIESGESNEEPEPTVALEEQIKPLFSLPVSIALNNFSITGIDVSLNETSIVAEQFSAALFLDQQGLEITNIHWLGEGLELETNLTLASNTLALGLELDWQLEGAVLNVPELASQTLSGELAIGGDLGSLEISHEIVQPILLSSNGSVETGLLDSSELSFAFQHEITDVSFFLSEDQPLESVLGVLTTAGTAINIDLGADFNIISNVAEPLNILLAANYSEQLLRLNQLSLNSEQILLQAEGDIILAPVLEVDMQWQLDRLNADAYLSSVSLDEVQGNGVIHFSSGDDDMFARIELSALNGVVNGYPLKISGLVDLENESLNEVDLRAELDSNSFTLIGNAAEIGNDTESLDLVWQLTAPELDKILPELSGQLVGSGSIAGTINAPELIANLQGETLAYRVGTNEYRLEEIILQADSKPTGNLISLSLLDISIPQAEAPLQLSQLNLSLEGLLPQHEISLMVLSDLGDFNLQSQGGLEGDAWLGEITSANLELESGPWLLEDSIALQLSSTALSYSEHCWLVLDLSLCSGGSWQADEVEGSNGIGTINSEFSVYTNALSGNELPENSLSESELPENALSEREPQGGLNVEVNIDAEQNIAGSVHVDFQNIAWLETLVPQLEQIGGKVIGDMSLAGNFSRPLLIGELAFSDIHFELPEFGIDIKDSDIEMQSESNNQIHIVGRFNSEDGYLSIESDLSTPLLDSRSVDVLINGENFQALNSSEAQVVIDPELKVRFVDNALNVDGTIHLSTFNLDLSELESELGSSGVSVSRDAIVVSAPAEQQELLAESEQQSIPVTASVSLTLGDDIHFKGMGLDMFLGGALQIEQSPDRPILAYGEVSILDGSYEIYSQKLSVENGKLLFFGNPLNPALDIRAFREERTATVGVQINGTLRNMQSQLFSTPLLPESEILSVLITGKSFNNINEDDAGGLTNAIANLGIARGQGLANAVRSQLGLDTLTVNGARDYRESSLGLGKYITPDLFLRYDIGLFDKGNSLSLDYSLSERVTLEVESGVSQSVDMTYTLEK